MLKAIKNKILLWFGKRKNQPIYIELATPYFFDSLELEGNYPYIVVRYPYKEEHLDEIKFLMKRAVDEVVGYIASDNGLDLIKDGKDNRADIRKLNSHSVTQTVLAVQGLTRLQLDDILNCYYIDIKKADSLEALLDVRVKHKALRRLPLFNMANTVEF